MTMIKRTGAKGALLDEYERAIIELRAVISDVTPGELDHIVDSDTRDPRCRSIKSILAHVISAGYSYANYIRRLKNVSYKEFPETTRENIEGYQADFLEMFSYNIETFDSFTEEEVEEHESEKKMLTRWGQLYDIEQLMEHAIVHILRHRRQIESFKQKLRVAAK